MAFTEPQPRTITIDAQGPFGPVPRLEYVIDVTDFRESSALPEGTLHLLTKALDRRPSTKDVTELSMALRQLGRHSDN